MGFAFLAFTGLLAILRLILAPFIDFHGAPLFDRPDFIFPFGLLGFLLLLASLAWGARSLRRMSMPLDNLLDASDRVARGDFSARVEEKGPPEVRALTRGFNSMAGRLEINDRQRRNMLADVSHELKTPLTIIQGNVEGMLDGMYAADERRLKSVLEETQVLSRLIDDLRTLAQAESGALELKREAVDLEAFIREIVSGFETQAAEKHVDVSLSLANAEPVSVDPQRLHEVLANVLSNALRYTPRGGVVTVHLTESGPGADRGVTISVQDSGSGIAAQELDQIFDRFYKSSDSGGMGLGLSIAKYLVEAHGGTIHAESEVGRGTRIVFALPRA
jgi:two-component system, OmpR family, sensor histidine kinase BaeS